MKLIVMMLLSGFTWAMVPERASAQTVVPCDVLCWAKAHQPGGQALQCQRKIGSQKEADYWKGIAQKGWGALSVGPGIALMSLDTGGNGLSCPTADVDSQDNPIPFTLRSVPVIGSVYGATVCGADVTDPKIGTVVKIDLCKVINDGRETNFFPSAK